MAASKAVTPPRTFQDLIFALQAYWSKQGCVILQPYDMEMGAGTFHTATLLRAVGPEPGRSVRAPLASTTDGRMATTLLPAAAQLSIPVVLSRAARYVDLYLAHWPRSASTC